MNQSKTSRIQVKYVKLKFSKNECSKVKMTKIYQNLRVWAWLVGPVPPRNLMPPATPLSPEPACLGNDFQKKNVWKLGEVQEVPWENMDLLPDLNFHGLDSRPQTWGSQPKKLGLWQGSDNRIDVLSAKTMSVTDPTSRIPQETNLFWRNNDSCSSVQQPSNIVETTNSRSITVVANIICTSKFQPKKMQSDARTYTILQAVASSPKTGPHGDGDFIKLATPQWQCDPDKYCCIPNDHVAT